MENWNLRLAGPADVPALTHLRIQFLLEVGDSRAPQAKTAIREYFERQLAGDDFRVWVAEAEGEIVATAGLLIVSKPPSGRNPHGREGYVMNVYTLPEWRGQCIATALLQQALDFLKDAGIPCCRLHVTGPGSLYEKLGFADEGSERVIRMVGKRLGELPAILASLPHLTDEESRDLDLDMDTARQELDAQGLLKSPWME